MYPENELKLHPGEPYIKYTSAATVTGPQPKLRSNGYTWEELMAMTPKEVAALKEATNDILATVRQSKFNNIATILWLQTQIEKERE